MSFHFNHVNEQGLSELHLNRATYPSKSNKRLRYNQLCSECTRSCKQSPKVIVCSCPLFSPSKVSKEE